MRARCAADTADAATRMRYDGSRRERSPSRRVVVRDRPGSPGSDRFAPLKNWSGWARLVEPKAGSPRVQGTQTPRPVSGTARVDGAGLAVRWIAAEDTPGRRGRDRPLRPPRRDVRHKTGTRSEPDLVGSGRGRSRGHDRRSLSPLTAARLPPSRPRTVDAPLQAVTVVFGPSVLAVRKYQRKGGTPVPPLPNGTCNADDTDSLRRRTETRPFRTAA